MAAVAVEIVEVVEAVGVVSMVNCVIAVLVVVLSPISTALPFKPGLNASTSRTLVWQPMQVGAVSSPKIEIKLYKAMIEAEAETGWNRFFLNDSASD